MRSSPGFRSVCRLAAVTKLWLVCKYFWNPISLVKYVFKYLRLFKLSNFNIYSIWFILFWNVYRVKNLPFPEFFFFARCLPEKVNDLFSINLLGEFTRWFFRGMGAPYPFSWIHACWRTPMFSSVGQIDLGRAILVTNGVWPAGLFERWRKDSRPCESDSQTTNFNTRW